MRPINRRNFLQSTLTGMTAAGVMPTLTVVGADAPSGLQPNGTFAEAAREIPLRRDADVVVCGAGPAGVAAAITAARSGARVRLFDVNGCLGGTWTAGLLTWIFDFNKSGHVIREITKRLDARGARHLDRVADPSRPVSFSSAQGAATTLTPSMFTYEPEAMKLVLEEMCDEAGVQVRLMTRVTAAGKEGRRLSTVITESKSGREAWQAPVFIDATGDGDLGAQAGCGWDIGTPKTHDCQPLTMNALAVVGDISQFKGFLSGGDLRGHIAATLNIRKDIQQAGIDPSYGNPTLFHVNGNVVLLMFNHEYGVKPYDADAMTRATIRGRREVDKIVQGLNKLGGKWAGLRMISSAEHIGVREGRRIHGRYTVTQDDLWNAARFEDAVTRVTFGVDIHHPIGRDGKPVDVGIQGQHRMLPYDIPLRALIAKDVDGLMMAGRCISGDFVAHASYRVTGDAAALGEGAGVVAALAAKNRCLPHEVPWKDAKAVLDQMT